MTLGGGDASLVSVAVPVPVRRLFTYAVPRRLVERASVGARVRVPFGGRRREGTIVAVGVPEPEPGIAIREIEDVISGAPALDPELLDLTRFIADYYLCSHGEAIEAALPPRGAAGPVVRKAVPAAGATADSLSSRAVAQRRVFAALSASGKGVPVATLSGADRAALSALRRAGLAEIVEEALVRGPAVGSAAAVGRDREAEPGPEPTEAQREVLDVVLPAVREGGWAPFLLYGATGSGKTEVYLSAARASLSSGRGVLWLVPEIGLTPLLVSRLERRFPGRVAVLHSGLSPSRRREAWERLRDGRADVALGARSAVFAPVRPLGLVVVDEEQDGSYKQDETPRYNGRDLAVMRARNAGATLLLGSATPSLESFHHAKRGRYRLLRLGGRIDRRPLATVRIVDMRREFGEIGEVRPLSRPLLDALEACLGRGEQALVLRNRRGWAPALYCPRCGSRAECDRCSVTLTWHRAERKLRCHTCDFETRLPSACPTCGGTELRLLGEGTERIEDELRRCFPEARIARLDRDTARRRGAHERILRSFDRGETDVLVGTQMIAKGHDFPNVTLVGILSADHALGLPDFRAGERTFQLLTQAAGRAGRGPRPGGVVIQAFEPGHPVLHFAAAQDFEAFYDREIRYRRALRYPPVTGLVRVVVRDADAGKAEEWSERLAEALRLEGGDRILLAGPGPAPIERVRGLWRRQILARTAGRRRLVEAVDRALDRVSGEIPRKALVVDVDPASVL